jgi:uncharacterized protein (TIGR02596 family)
MIVVMGVIILLLALVVPATVTLMRGSQITQGGDLLTAQLEVARQIALARNKTVQVRICRPNGGKFTILMPLFPVVAVNQTSGAITTTYSPAGKPATLPNSVIIDSGANLSSVLNQTGISVSSASATDPTLGSLGTNYQYVPFQFRPDGSSDLMSQISPSNSSDGTPLWFLTVHNATDGDSLNTPPPNYYTVQIDPYNGHVRDFRP